MLLQSFTRQSLKVLPRIEKQVPSVGWINEGIDGHQGGVPLPTIRKLQCSGGTELMNEVLTTATDQLSQN